MASHPTMENVLSERAAGRRLAARESKGLRPRDPYSARNADTGSIRDARLAGR